MHRRSVRERLIRVTVLLAIASVVLGLSGSAVSGMVYRPDVVGSRGVVTSAHSLASYAGIEVLQKGGNAVDAAIAVASTITIVEPNLSSAGGNGHMTVYEAASNKVYTLQMTGATPYATPPELVNEPAKLSKGYMAGLVPGNFGGWVTALERFGTMSLAEVLGPAIYYAENGFPVSPGLSSGIANQKTTFELYPTTAKVFLPGGKAPAPGELLKQTDTAKTFKKLVEAEQKALKQGKSRSEALMAAFDRFYKGDIAQEFVRFLQENKGLMTMKDLADYRPIWREPLHTTYRGYDVYTQAPTSRGIEVILELNLIEAFDVAKLGHNSAATLHLIAECCKIAKSDVYEYVADPKVVDVPIEGLASKEYAAERRKLIDPAKAMPYPEPGNPALFQKQAWTPPVLQTASVSPVTASYDEEGCTTSYTVVDQWGNSVSSTQTLGGGWGDAVVKGSTGLMFNNGMREGSISIYPDNVNCLVGGKVPLLGTMPTVVLKNGKLLLSYGTPGGEGIQQTMFQVLLNILDFKMGIQEAIEAPRFQLSPDPDFYTHGAKMAISIESRVPADVIKALQAMGHTVKVSSEFTSGVGGFQGVLINQAAGTMAGGADPRRGGYAIGY